MEDVAGATAGAGHLFGLLRRRRVALAALDGAVGQGDAGVGALAFAGVVLGSHPDPVGDAGCEVAEGGGRFARRDLAVLALAGVGVLDVRDVAVGRSAGGRGLPGDDDLVALGRQLQADHRAGCLQRRRRLLLWLWLLLFGSAVVGDGDGLRLGARLGHLDAVGGHTTGTADHDVQLGRAAVGRERQIDRRARGPHPRRAREGRRALARTRMHTLPATPVRRQRHARRPRQHLRPVRRHPRRERRAQRHRCRTGPEREPGHGQRVALSLPRRVLRVLFVHDNDGHPGTQVIRRDLRRVDAVVDVQHLGAGVRVPSGADRERQRARVSRLDPDPPGRDRDRVDVAVAGGADARGNVRGVLQRRLQTHRVGRAGALPQPHRTRRRSQKAAVVVDDLDRDHQAMVPVLEVPPSPVRTAADAVMPDPVPGARRRLAHAVVHRGEPHRLGPLPVPAHVIGMRSGLPSDRVVDREPTVVDLGVIAAVRPDVVMPRRDSQIRSRRLMNHDAIGERCTLSDLHAPGPKRAAKPINRHTALAAQRGHGRAVDADLHGRGALC